MKHDLFPGGGGDLDSIQRHLLRLFPVPHAQPAPGAINQDMAHGFGGGAEEMPPVFPSLFFIAQQAQVRLVDQGRGLQRLARRLERHLMRRQFSEFFVHEGEQLVGSLGIAAFKRLQDASDFGHAVRNSITAWAKEVGRRAPWSGRRHSLSVRTASGRQD